MPAARATRLFFRAARIITLILALGGLGVASLVVFHIPIGLNALIPKIETAAVNALGRPVTLEGPVRLIPGMWTTIEVNGLRVGNAPGWETADFANIGQMRAEIALLPLLSKEIRFGDIGLHGVELHLETRPDGTANWRLPPAKTEAESLKPLPVENRSAPMRFVEIKSLVLDGMTAGYRSAAGQLLVLTIDEMTAHWAEKADLAVAATGTYHNQPFSVTFAGGRLDTLLAAASPWPLDVSAESTGAHLALKGSVEPSAMRADLTVSGAGKRIEDLGDLLGTPLPPFGPFGVDFRLTATPDRVSLEDLQATLGKSKFKGQLQWNPIQDRPLLSARIAITDLDAGPIMAFVPPKDTSEIDPLKAPEARFSGDALRKIDFDVSLSVGRVLNFPGAIHDASVELSLEEGHLNAPVALTMLGAGIKGVLRASAAANSMDLDIDLAVLRADVGKVARAFSATPDLQGHLKHFKLKAASRGSDLPSLLAALELSATAQDVGIVLGNTPNHERVYLALESATAALKPGEGLEAKLLGTIRDQPFSAHLTGGGMQSLTTAVPWPVTLTVSGAGARFKLDGTLAPPSTGGSSEVEISVFGERIGDLAAWVDVSPQATASYQIDAAFRQNQNQWRLECRRLRVGRSSLSGHLGKQARRSPRPLLLADLRAETLDWPQIVSLFETTPQQRSENPEPTAAANRKKIAGTRLADFPIFPEDIHLFDADLKIAIARMITKTVVLTHLSLNAQTRNNQVVSAPFQFAVEQNIFQGDLSMDFNAELPVANWHLSSRNTDMGALLQTLGVAQGLRLRVGGVDAHLEFKGRRLGEILTHRQLSISATDGQWTAQDPGGKEMFDIRISRADFQDDFDNPATIQMAGLIDNTPLEMEMAFSHDLEKGGIPFDLEARSAGARLELAGLLALPVSQRNLRLQLSITGDRLDELDPLLGVELPPFGPYALDGDFSVGGDGYSLSDLLVRVGASKLSGGMQLVTGGQRPRLEVDLVSPTIQLADFDLEDWSITAGAEQEDVPADGPTTSAQPKQAPSQAGGKTRGLLDPEVINAYDADISIRVKEVLSGKDHLGSAIAKLRQENGTHTLDPFKLEIPGGLVTATVKIQTGADDLAAHTTLNVQELDYGVLARRADPDSKMDGLISLDVDLKSHAVDVKGMPANANGHFDMSIKPGNIQSGIIDLWAVNLLSALVPVLTPNRESRVNCGVARFDVQDGLMRPEALLIDTTRIQVKGKGQIDLKNQTVNLLLRPKPKRPQFFSLATPIEVSGSFSDFSVGMAPGGLIGTAIRLATSYITVPIQWVIFNRLPADGSEACAKAMERK